ncbi:MAG: Rne/Rng family ribonuclease [Beijerinckiaceae bacterium]
MAINRMLVDASHPEETRVVVQRGNRIDEFDFESSSRKQLRGNIYLAKVTRVEPSLQAAFVEYGGNRHGFLAFSEIHPDYYQIPVADRQALLEEEARFAEQDEADENDEGANRKRGRRRRGGKSRSAQNGETVSENAPAEGSEEAAEAASDDNDGNEVAASAEQEATSDNSSDESSEEADRETAEAEAEEQHVEQIGGSDAMEDMREQRRSFRPRKQYKIQEVIKRRQILLIQVVKEERGNKGAALTTYLSLAGRYSVLMPNTSRGGGISRKITNSADRKRLKELSSDLEVPDGMGVILRTAGASRTKPEIKRDFEYLLRVWEQVRETTLQSVAPMLVHEEGSLIKRSLRDLFGKEVDEVVVSGEAGYKEARDFMKMLMPSQVKAIKAYREPQPLFARHGIESQLDAMFSTTVTLRSGGYIVINPTEALVSIDVNSGRSTREHNIEDTALKTNLEAAEEVARQLRLRDLAGLIVIDFIDMEEHRNNRTVEKKLKDCLKNDRARIQVGRISPFGLMEMSRQRMRTGVLESSTMPCPHCGGSGFLRSISSVALLILRSIEEALLKNAQFHLNIKTRTEVALYILNQKRLTLREIEKRFGVTIAILADDSLHGTNYYTLERGEPAPEGGLRVDDTTPIVDEIDEDIPEETFEDEAETSASDEADSESSDDSSSSRDDSENGGRRGRRRRRRGGRDRGDREPRADRPQSAAQGDDSEKESDDEDGDESSETEASSSNGSRENGNGERDGGRRRRRRGRRGGRRNRFEGEAQTSEGAAVAADSEGGATVTMTEEPVAVVAAEPTPVAEEAAAPKKRGRKKAEAPAEAIVVEAVAEPAEKPKRGRAKKVVAEVAVEPVVQAVAAPAPVVEAPAPVAKKPEPKPEPVIEPEIEDPNRPKRSGWWSKAKKALGGE